MKLLVIEDDAKLAQLLRRVLQEEGYVVDLCDRGQEGLRQAATPIYDLVVLDWMLPDLDGLTVCRELRRRGATVPVLMLTARGELGEKVLGLESGADDYMVKPFEIEELLARIHALTRRAGALGKLVSGPLEIDRERRRATVGGVPCELTTREYDLLIYLVRRAGQVVKRNDLLREVWETSSDSPSNSLDVHVSRLREKLGAYAWLIETVRGAGYRLQASPPSP